MLNSLRTSSCPWTSRLQTHRPAAAKPAARLRRAPPAQWTSLSSLERENKGAVTGTIGVISTAINSPIDDCCYRNGVGAVHLRNERCRGSQSGRGDQYSTHNHCRSEEWSGTAPTGTVTMSYTTWTVVIPSSGPNAGIPTITPQMATATSNLTSGAASFTLSPVLAGTQTMTVYYSGDRVYGRSTGTMSVNVAKSAITGIKICLCSLMRQISTCRSFRRGLAAEPFRTTDRKRPSNITSS